MAQDALVYLNEESCHTDAFTEEIPGVIQSLEDLKHEFSSAIVDDALLQAAAAKCPARVALKTQRYAETVSHILPFIDHTQFELWWKQVNAILAVAERPTSHVSTLSSHCHLVLTCNSGDMCNSRSASCTASCAETKLLHRVWRHSSFGRALALTPPSESPHRSE